jgi:hypothetical protein
MHNWFDAFKTLKFVPYLQDNGYPGMEILRLLRRD